MATNDTVKVKFDIDPSGAGTQALREKDRLVQEIAQHFVSLGQKMPTAQIRELAGLGVNALRQIKTEIGAVNRELDQFNSAKVLEELIRIGGETKSEQALVKSLRDEFTALGVDLPVGKFQEFGITGKTELKVILDQARLLRSEIETSSKALQNLKNLERIPVPGRGQAPLGGQFNVRSRTGAAGDDFSDRIAAGDTGQSRKFAEENAAALSGQARSTQDLSRANESLRGRFESAAASGKKVTGVVKDMNEQLKITEAALRQGAVIGTTEYDKIAKSIGSAANQGRVFSGTTYVGTQLLRTFGVEGSRALEVVGRQFLDLGLTFKDLLASGIFRATAVFAGFIAVGEITQNITGKIRALNEQLLLTQRIAAQRNNIGLGLDPSQIDADLQKLEKLRKDVLFLRSTGKSTQAERLEGETLGGRSSQSEINNLRIALSEAKRQSFTLFDLVKKAVEASILQPGLFDTEFDKNVRAAQDRLTKALGGQLGPLEVQSREAAARINFNLQELFKFRTGGGPNIFDEARKSLAELARSTGSQANVSAFISDLVKQAEDGTLGFNEYTKSLSRFTEQLQRTAAIQQEVTSIRATSRSIDEQRKNIDNLREVINGIRGGVDTGGGNELVDRTLRSLTRLDLSRNDIFRPDVDRGIKQVEAFNEAQRDILTLRSELANNPLERLIAQADKRTSEFLNKVKSLPDEMRVRLTSAFSQLNTETRNLEVFKFDTTLRGTIQGLTGDLARLEARVGSNVAGIAEDDRRRQALGQLLDARSLGDTGALRVAQAALISRQAGLEEQIRQARSGRQFGRAAELETQLGALGREAVGASIERQLRESELTALRDRLGQANGLQQQVFILDRILEATSKVGDLNEEQRDFRLRALQQRLSIGEAERHRVLIEIKNSADNVQASIDQDLGPNSGSASSAFSSVGGGSSSPFGGDFDSINGGF